MAPGATRDIWKCLFCDKKFKTCEFLSKHMISRHEDFKLKVLSHLFRKWQWLWTNYISRTLIRSPTILFVTTGERASVEASDVRRERKFTVILTNLKARPNQSLSARSWSTSSTSDDSIKFSPYNNDRASFWFLPGKICGGG